MNAREEYLVRFAKVLAYVDANLGGDLTVETLSGVAAFSKFHFHRQFSGVFGIGVYEYVQLMRLKRAAFDLAFRDARSVLEIALDAGYESPEAFARAFKRRIGQTPSDFRKQPDWLTWDETYRPVHEIRRTTNMTTTASNIPTENDVRLINFDETRVALLEHRGDVRKLGDTIRQFIAWRKQNNVPRASGLYNLLYNDPEVTPPDEFHLDICVAMRGRVPENTDGIVEHTIPGGRCAVLRLVGTDDGLGSRINYLYREWLPSSGHELRDFPCFIQRVQFFPDVPEAEAITDIFLPLK